MRLIILQNQPSFSLGSVFIRVHPWFQKAPRILPLRTFEIQNSKFEILGLLFLIFLMPHLAHANPIALSPDAVAITAPDAIAGASYDLERSLNRGSFHPLARVSAGQRYIDGDALPGTLHQYRFKLVTQVESPVLKAGTPPVALALALPPGKGKLILTAGNAGDNNHSDHGVWTDSFLSKADGSTLPLATLKPVSASVGYQDTYNGSYEIPAGNVPGLWAHAPSEYVYELDGSFTSFRTAVVVAGNQRQGSVVFTIRYEPQAPVKTETLAITTPALEKPATDLGRTFYIDSVNGNDSNPGLSIDQPFKTLDRVNKLQLLPGDRILLHLGQTHAGRLSLHGPSTYEDPIVVSSYEKSPHSGAPPVIDAGKDYIAPLVLHDATYVELANIALAGDALEGNTFTIQMKLSKLSQSFDVDTSKLVDARPSGKQSKRLMIEPLEGTWDLSAFSHLNLTFQRQGNAKAVVSYRLENADAGILRNCVSDLADLRTADPVTVRLPIVVRPLDPGYEYFRPYYMYVNSMDVRDGTVDPQAIRRVVVAVEKGDARLIALKPAGEGPSLPQPFFPFIDAYGQYIHSHWHGKIYAEEDLKKAAQDEAAELAAEPGPASWNDYGGYKDGPTLPATGFFYPAKHNGKWWLVDPVGKLFFSYGPTGVGLGGDGTPVTQREFWFESLPPRSGDASGGTSGGTAKFWHKGKGARFMFYSQGKPWESLDIGQYVLSRKYGENYVEAVAELSHQRMRSWGFTTIGNWSDGRVYLKHKTPYTVAIHFHNYDFGHHHDVYDPAFQSTLRQRMEKERDTSANDPWNIGYFVDNEVWWGTERDGLNIARRTLQAPAKQWAKQDFVRDLQAQHGDIAKLNAAWQMDYASWEDLLNRTDVPKFSVPGVNQDVTAFGRKFVQRYFEICREEVKRVAPNNLYLGCRFHGHLDPSIIKIAGEFCDVISYNIYDGTPAPRVNQYVKHVDKPFLSGEWGFGSDYRQTPFGRGATEWDPDGRPKFIHSYMASALKHPLIVGAHFFQYRDQPISGRPDGEAILRGFVNITDTPHDELVRASRELAEKLYPTRLKD